MLKLLIFLVFTVQILCDSPYGDFQAPQYKSSGNGPFGTNPSWQIGSVQSIIWNTTISSYDIYLWQNDPGVGSQRSSRPVYSKSGTAATEQQRQDWLVDSLDFDIGKSSIFLLWLTNTANGNEGFVSSYFNMTAKNTVSSGTPSSSQSPSQLSTSQPHNQTSSTQTQTQTMTSEQVSKTTNDDATTSQTEAKSTIPSSDDGLNANAKIGLGLGLGIGVPLLVLLGVLIGLHMRQTQGMRDHVLLEGEMVKETRPPHHKGEWPVLQYRLHEAPDGQHMAGQALNLSELDDCHKYPAELMA